MSCSKLLVYYFWCSLFPRVNSSSIWYYLFSTWRKSFGFSCNKFYQLLLIWRCNYFGLLFEGYFNSLYDSVLIVGFFPFVKDGIPWSSGFYFFWWEVSCYLYYYSSIYKTSPRPALWLLSGLFYLFLIFNSLIVMCLGVIFFFFFFWLVHLEFVAFLGL